MRFDEFPFGPGLSIHELTDESNSCRHGNLPFDRNLDCDCWNLVWRPKRQPAKLSLHLGGSEPHPERSVRGPEAKRRPRYPTHVKRRAVRLYASGVSSHDVAAQFGASTRVVLHWVRAAGVEVRHRGPQRRAA